MHYLSILSLIIPPFYFTNIELLILYNIYANLVILHWKFLNDGCWLTALEKIFYPNEYQNKSGGGFVAEKFRKYGFIKLAEFRYFTDVILLNLILISLIKIYKTI